MSFVLRWIDWANKRSTCTRLSVVHGPRNWQGFGSDCSIAASFWPYVCGPIGSVFGLPRPAALRACCPRLLPRFVWFCAGSFCA